MARQLKLIPARKDWHLDEKTKQAGRSGLASARAALAGHRPDDGDHPDHPHHPDQSGHGHRRSAA
ncbi:MAG: hypothetical protein KDA95_06860 [Acidimicrobiales bacterium]|nr:hypothetical protein [Acidimicrobiales bacterium]